MCNPPPLQANIASFVRSVTSALSLKNVLSVLLELTSRLQERVLSVAVVILVSQIRCTSASHKSLHINRTNTTHTPHIHHTYTTHTPHMLYPLLTLTTLYLMLYPLLTLLLPAYQVIITDKEPPEDGSGDKWCLYEQDECQYHAYSEPG